MAWGSSTVGTSPPLWGLPSWSPKALSFLSKASGPAAAAALPYEMYNMGGMIEENPSLIGMNPTGVLSFLTKVGVDKMMGWNKPYRKSEDSAGTAAPDKTLPQFIKSMEKSIKKAATEDDEEDDPFNYNQLFIASILKGLKEKPPKTAAGKSAGTYIPRPDLPKMADYDSNKTYWNIG